MNLEAKLQTTAKITRNYWKDRNMIKSVSLESEHL